MATVYEEVIPSLISNTTMLKSIVDGELRSYRITPIDGYVMHDKMMDVEVLDEITHEPTGEVLTGYRASTAGVGYNYDFVANPREFYAVLTSEVPADQIF